MYVYSELFNDIGVPPERILYLPAIELDIYTDRRLVRSGALFYVGKGQKIRDLSGAGEVTSELKRDQARLADTLNRAEVLYCFDNATAMTLIARLCGCPVVLIPNGDYTREQYDRSQVMDGLGWDEVPPPFDSDAIRASELAAYETFRERLAGFITVTQA